MQPSGLPRIGAARNSTGALAMVSRVWPVRVEPRICSRTDNTKLFADRVLPELKGLFSEWEDRWWPQPMPRPEPRRDPRL
jgi:hypothetical protein